MFWRLKSAPSAMAPLHEIAHHGGTESQPRPSTMTKTILIVEDNELNMKLFHDLLDAHGYKTLQTRNGMEALALAREHRPDLILMDIQLPEVSGLEVTKWLKEDDELRTIPVVAVTAFAMKGDEERIREGGCEAYISKPISVSSFLDTVRQFIGEAR
jgi:two-component system, cell cycle response regulator DivK